MATATALTSDSVAALRQEVYTQGVQDGLRSGVFFWNMAKTASDFSLAGKRAVFSINFARSTGVRAIPQTGGYWPPAQSPNPKTFYVERTMVGGTIKWEEQAKMITMDHAFATAEGLSLQSWWEHFQEEMERKALSNGSGVLNIMGGIARVPGGGALAPTAASWTFAISIWDAPKIRENMQFEIWRCPTALNSTNWRNATRLDRPSQGYYTVSSVLEVPASGVAIVTVAEASPGTAPPVAAGEFGTSTNLDFLVVPDSVVENASASTTNLGYEMLGLDALACGDNGMASSAYGDETGVQWLQIGGADDALADDMFQGLSPVTNGKWNANIIDSATYGNTLSRQCLGRATTYQNVFGTRGSNGWKAFIGHPAQINEYAQTLENAERFTIEGPTPAYGNVGRPSLHQNDGQGEALQFAGIPFYGSRFCRVDRVYGMNDEGVEKVFLQDFAFKAPIQAKDNSIAQEMNGIGAMNMFTRNRKCLLAIHNLATPSAV